MRTLADALTWYRSNRQLLKLTSRLGGKYWNDLPWDGAIGRDDQFRLLEGDRVETMADATLGELDDLAVFVLFSVFESIVRGHVAESLRGEVSGLRHPALRRSADRMLRNIEEGSFYANVLDLFKQNNSSAPEAMAVNSLIEAVSQVRRYRNWVANGRRAEKKLPPIAPLDAFDTLKEFLEHIQADPRNI